MSLIVLAFLVSIGTVAGLVKLTTSAIEGSEAENAESDSSLTVDVSDTELTIELADDPVFAVLPVDVTVKEATLAGYTLTASTNDTSLVSTTDSSKVIPTVAADEGELVALADNTYGLALEEKPTTKDAEVYMPLSTDSSNPTILKAIDDYSSTPANDTTTIYYGFYITPDTPYGTYTGSNITVDAIPNIATVTYNANGLYFNDSEEDTINTVGYKPNIAEAPIEEVVGEYITPAPLTLVDPSTTIHYTFLGWSETEGATTPDYEDEEDILANLTLTKNESLTLYAVWHYDTVLSFNGTTSDGGEAIEQQTIAAGTTITLPQNTYTRTGSVFTSWNTVAEPTEQDPGVSYADEADFTAPDSSADITLYAQWAYYTTITFNGNGADSGYMSPQDIIAGTPETLTPNAFTKTNATFIGWNTVQYPTPENPGTAYEDQAEYIASTTEHQDITLYAQWAYTTISFNGNTSDAGTMNPITIAGGATSNLPAKAFTKNNCIFIGWNTEANGTGISYGNSSPYTANATAKEAFTLYAQWQCISQVNYYGNGATSGEMASSIILGGSALTLSQNSYARDGYIFNGWNTVQNPTAENPGTSYPDQGSYTAPMTTASTLNLYAQWMQPTMQNVALWGSSLSQGDSMQVPDTRDGKSYWVAKLADGNIWMTQNLDLCIGCDDVATLTSENTDLNTTSGNNRPYYDGYSHDGTTIIWSPTEAANSIEGGDIYIYSSGSADNDITYNSLTECTTAGHSAADCNHYHVGNYYNWTTAIASNRFSRGSSFEAENSICPKGWKLPNADSESSGFGKLFLSTGIVFEHESAEYTFDEFNKLRIDPYYLTRGGQYSSSTLSDRSQYGYYWGNKFFYYYDYPNSTEGSYYFKLGASSVSFGDYAFGRRHVIRDSSNDFLSLRCIAR